MRILVVQMGARHRYAIPRMLERAGLLEALYTDTHAGTLLGRVGGLLPQLWKPLARLANRQIWGVPRGRIRATDMVTVATPLLCRSTSNWYEYYRARDRVFSAVIERWGFGDATTIYSMFGEGLGFVRQAKERGLRVALDVFVNPMTHRILQEERRLYPGWEESDAVDFRALERDVDARIAMADVLLCPSDFVVEGLSHYPSFREAKVRVVPYGFATDVRPRKGTPQRGRVLFAGEAGLRKGIQYLGTAAELLAARRAAVHFRVAGSAHQRIRSRPELWRLEFLGPLPRHAFLKELEAADIFVLPTLAEGSASVIYEALAYGVPVVTTPCAGAVITDGIEGRLVPPRNALALADAIEEIVCDRNLRERMSAAALATAASYGEEQWRERLVEALKAEADEPSGYG